MGNRKTSKHPNHRMEHKKKHKKKSLNVSEKYSESLIALNESTFKIRRFMNDVSTYKENPSTKTKKTRYETESKDKENVCPKSGLTFQGKKGLFENGVATKTRTFCRGLMPPMWNARLNADLRSILNLACVEAPKRHATSPSVVKPIDDASESLRSRSPDATLINSRLARRIEKKSSSPERSKKHKLQSTFNDDEDDESMVHASCSQVGAAAQSEPAATESEVASRAVSEDAPVAEAKSDVVDAVNFSDYYLRFTHCIIKSLSSTRFDREELENTSKKPVRFLAEFYRERLAQALEEQKEEESPSFLPKDVFQSNENVQRSQPTFSQPSQYGANTIRSDEWPRISLMRAQADEQFLDDSVRKSKIYTSGLELLEAVYGQNNDDEHQKTYNHLSVTPPKCIFSPIAEDIASNSSFLNPVSGKKDWLPCFKCSSPPETKSCACSRSDEVMNCDFSTCDDNLCRNNVMDYDFMTCVDGQNVRNCDFTSGLSPSTSRGCWDGRSCFLNDTTVRNCNGRVENTFDRCSRSRTAVTTADCLKILPPKSRRLDQWRTSGPQTKLGIKVEGSVDDTKDLLTLPLRAPARESPDIQYYPRRMF